MCACMPTRNVQVISTDRKMKRRGIPAVRGRSCNTAYLSICEICFTLTVCLCGCWWHGAGALRNTDWAVVFGVRGTAGMFAKHWAQTIVQNAQDAGTRFHLDSWVCWDWQENTRRWTVKPNPTTQIQCNPSWTLLWSFEFFQCAGAGQAWALSSEQKTSKFFQTQLLPSAERQLLLRSSPAYMFVPTTHAPHQSAWLGICVVVLDTKV